MQAGTLYQINAMKLLRCLTWRRRKNGQTLRLQFWCRSIHFRSLNQSIEIWNNAFHFYCRALRLHQERIPNCYTWSRVSFGGASEEAYRKPHSKLPLVWLQCINNSFSRDKNYCHKYFVLTFCQIYINENNCYIQ